MSVPKVLHYCWFGGGPKPPLVQQCLRSWQTFAPGYDAVEWTEKSFDISVSDFAVRHYERREWAYVADVARLHILETHGGVYLDTDVEMRRSFDPLLDTGLFLGFMFDCILGTAVIGAEAGHPSLRALLSLYDADSVPTGSVNNEVFTWWMLSAYPDFRLDGRRQSLADRIEIYPKECFERPTRDRRMGYSVHHALGSWQSSKPPPLRRRLTERMLGEIAYAQVAHLRHLRRSPFYAIYREHTGKANRRRSVAG